MADTKPVPLSTVPAAARIVATNEKVTGPAGLELLRRCFDSPRSGPCDVLDNATGGGVIISHLQDWTQKHPDAPRFNRIIAGDNDDRMLDYIRKRVDANHWRNVEVQRIDQTSVPFNSESFDYVFSNFGIFFHPNDEKTLTETYHVLKPGGVAGFTSWNSIAWWSSVAIPALREYLPDAPTLPERVEIFPAPGWTDASSIPAKPEKAGFRDVKVSEYAFTPDVEAEEFAEAMAVLVGVVARRAWSKEDVNKHYDGIEGAILRYLKQNYEGGKWDGEMVALVTVGRKP